MPDQNSYSLLNAGVARLNKSMHSSFDPRDKMIGMMDRQGRTYDAESPVGLGLVRKRHGERRLSNYSDFIPKSNVPPTRPFARRGTGLAYVPKVLPPSTKTFGRPLAINHEFEHAFEQHPKMPADKTEIAPVLGDLVFGAENFRRQEGRPLLGKIPVGYKNQDVEWMRGQAQKHGYFDGRSMTSLLGTPEGISYLKQAALGPLSQRKD
jgi:hypothetical protein